jgi:Co/Zn/Cd efflux system component
MQFTLVVPDFSCSMPKLSNQHLLEISTTLFFLFVISEIVGAGLSNSLSLLGDAASMSVDVSTYICNIYGEWAKNNSQRGTVTSRIVLDLVIPGVSTAALMAVTIYICFDAIAVLLNPPATNDVNTDYLYGFAGANLVVDMVCAYLFHAHGDAVFLESNSVPQLSLDTSVSFDEVMNFIWLSFLLFDNVCALDVVVCMAESTAPFLFCFFATSEESVYLLLLCCLGGRLWSSGR